MLNKWLFIVGLACAAVPLGLFLLIYPTSKHEPYIFVLMYWTIPFAFIAVSLLPLASFRFVATIAGLGSGAANLTAGGIAIGQWVVIKIAGVGGLTELLSSVIAFSGLALLSVCLVVWWRTQGLQQ